MDSEKLPSSMTEEKEEKEVMKTLIPLRSANIIMVGVTLLLYYGSIIPLPETLIILVLIGGINVFYFLLDKYKQSRSKALKFTPLNWAEEEPKIVKKFLDEGKKVFFTDRKLKAGVQDSPDPYVYFLRGYREFDDREYKPVIVAFGGICKEILSYEEDKIVIEDIEKNLDWTGYQHVGFRERQYAFAPLARPVITRTTPELREAEFEEEGK